MMLMTGGGLKMQQAEAKNAVQKVQKSAKKCKKVQKKVQKRTNFGAGRIIPMQHHPAHEHSDLRPAERQDTPRRVLERASVGLTFFIVDANRKT